MLNPSVSPQHQASQMTSMLCAESCFENASRLSGETVYMRDYRSVVHHIPLGELLSLSITDLVGSNCCHWHE